MRSMRIILGVVSVAALALAGTAGAQQYRTVDNPLQEEFEYVIGTELKPWIMVDGVRWISLRIEPKEGKELVDGDEIPTVMTLEFENPGSDGADVLAIVLLEDENGNQLARLEAGTIKVKGERLTKEKKKLKVDGGALRYTRQLWAFIEVTR